MPRREYGAAPGTLLTGLAAAKAEKLAEINAAFDAVASSLTAAYPETEVLTFDQQVSEAKAYLADNTAACPMLAPLARARYVTLGDLCTRVLTKHQAFSAITGALMGQRQALEDRVNAAEHLSEVRRITVDIVLPAIQE